MLPAWTRPPSSETLRSRTPVRVTDEEPTRTASPLPEGYENVPGPPLATTCPSGPRTLIGAEAACAAGARASETAQATRIRRILRLRIHSARGRFPLPHRLRRARRERDRLAPGRPSELHVERRGCGRGRAAAWNAAPRALPGRPAYGALERLFGRAAGQNHHLPRADRAARGRRSRTAAGAGSPSRP